MKVHRMIHHHHHLSVDCVPFLQDTVPHISKQTCLLKCYHKMRKTNDREDGNDCSDDNANYHLQEVPLMVNRRKQWKFYSSSVVVVLVPLISIIISMKVHGGSHLV